MCQDTSGMPPASHDLADEVVAVRNLPTTVRHFPIQLGEPSLPPLADSSAIDRRDGECAVDPDLVREFGGRRRASHEAVGPGGVGRGQHVSAGARSPWGHGRSGLVGA